MTDAGAGRRARIAPTREAVLAGILCALALLATLGDGGADPTVLLLLHGGIVALILAILLVPGTGEGRARPGPLTAFSAFFCFAVAGAAVAPYGYAAYLCLLELAAFVAVGLLASRFAGPLTRFLPWGLLVGAAAQGGSAAYQWILEDRSRPAGTFQNPSHLGAWLAVGLLVGLGTPGRDGFPRERALRVLLAVPAAVALVLTRSRGAFAGLVLGAVLLAALWWRHLGRRRRIAVVASVATVVVLASVTFALRRGEYDPYRYTRLRIWRSSLSAVVERPWTGTGPRQFEAAAPNLNFASAEGPLRFERSFSSPHSDWLRLPCEFGWPATLAALIAILLAAGHVGRGLRTGRLGRVHFGAIAGVVVLGVQGAVDDLTDRPALYLLAAILLGVLLSEVDRPARRWRPTARAAVATILVAGFLVGDVATYRAWMLSSGLPRGRLNPDERGRLEMALRRNPLHPDLWLRRAEDLLGREAKLDVESYGVAREAAERAVRLQPADARYRVGLARVEAEGCVVLFRDEASRERAVRRYEEAEALARHDPFIVLEKGGFLLATADPRGARRAAERVLAMEPNAVPARLLLAEARLASGDPNSKQDASRLLREAVAVAERWQATPKETTYARRLLTLDDRSRERIRRRIAP